VTHNKWIVGYTLSDSFWKRLALIVACIGGGVAMLNSLNVKHQGRIQNFKLGGL